MRIVTNEFREDVKRLGYKFVHTYGGKVLHVAKNPDSFYPLCSLGRVTSASPFGGTVDRRVCQNCFETLVELAGDTRGCPECHGTTNPKRFMLRYKVWGAYNILWVCPECGGTWHTFEDEEDWE